MNFTAYMQGVSQRFTQGERIEDQETLRRIFGMPTATPEETERAQSTVPGNAPPENEPSYSDIFAGIIRAGGIGPVAIGAQVGASVAGGNGGPVGGLIARISAIGLGAGLILVGLVLSARGSVVNLAIGKALKLDKD